MHDSAEVMKSYYSARASYYDAVYEKPERAADIAFLCEHLPDRLHGREVLEVACGTGFWSQHIAPACTRYVATDGVAEPLAIVRERLRGVTDECHVADAYALPQTLGRFNGAFSGLWLSHVPVAQRREFFDSLHALLLPGARVVLIDNSAVQCNDFPIVETDVDGNTWQQRPLRDGTTHRVLKNFPVEAELRDMVAFAGAQSCHYLSLDNFWYFEYELPGV
ncbi:MAG: class I SAM-dependent methyltransferase [Rhodocyclaceae bacterium]